MFIKNFLVMLVFEGSELSSTHVWIKSVVLHARLTENIGLEKITDQTLTYFGKIAENFEFDCPLRVSYKLHHKYTGFEVETLSHELHCFCSFDWRSIGSTPNPSD